MVRDLQRRRWRSRTFPWFLGAYGALSSLGARSALAAPTGEVPVAPPTGDVHDLDDSSGETPPAPAPPAPAPLPPAPASPAPAPPGATVAPAPPPNAPPGRPEAEYPQGEPETATETSDLARPEAIHQNERRHDGYFMRFGAGVTTSFGRRDSTQSGRASGTGFEMSFGGTPWTGVVIGGGFMGTGFDSRFELVSYFGFVNYYPDPKNGLHFDVLGGLSLLANVSNLAGPSVAGGVGYEFWVGKQSSLGGLARLGYATLSGKQRDSTTGNSGTASADSAFLTLHFVWTWH